MHATLEVDRMPERHFDRVWRALVSFGVAAVVVGVSPSRAWGQLDWFRSEAGWVMWTWSNESSRGPEDVLRIRTVVVNPTSTAVVLPYSPCDHLRGAYPSMAESIRCSQPGSELLEGDSAWAELGAPMGAAKGGTRSRSSFPVRVPYVARVEAEGPDPEVMEDVVRDAVLRAPGVVPLPATREAADRMVAYGPYLDITVQEGPGGGYALRLCWRRRGEGEAPSGEPCGPVAASSRPIGSEAVLGARLFAIVQEALATRPRAPAPS